MYENKAAVRVIEMNNFHSARILIRGLRAQTMETYALGDKISIFLTVQGSLRFVEIAIVIKTITKLYTSQSGTRVLAHTFCSFVSRNFYIFHPPTTPACFFSLSAAGRLFFSFYMNYTLLCVAGSALHRHKEQGGRRIYKFQALKRLKQHHLGIFFITSWFRCFSHISLIVSVIYGAALCAHKETFICCAQ
jgi:hypothetical protein